MKIAFLDRDGVINTEVNYLYRIDDFRFTDRCVDGLLNLRNLGFQIVIITNQAGIAKGLYSVKDYFTLTEHLLRELTVSGVDILDIIYCPHHKKGVVKEFTLDCSCRKPLPGMIDRVKSEYDVNLEESIVVGDKSSDLQAGIAAGINNLFLVESGHNISDQDRMNYPVFLNLFEVSVDLGS